MIEQKEATSEKAVLIGVITQKQDETKQYKFIACCSEFPARKTAVSR